MPIYTFRCTTCAHLFDKLQRRSTAPAPSGPVCNASTERTFGHAPSPVPKKAVPAPVDVGPLWEGPGCYVAVGVILPGSSFDDALALNRFVDAVKAANTKHGSAWRLIATAPTNARDRPRVELLLGRVVTWCSRDETVELELDQLRDALSTCQGWAESSLSELSKQAPEPLQSHLREAAVQAWLGTAQPDCAFARVVFGEELEADEMLQATIALRRSIAERELPLKLVRSGSSSSDNTQILGQTLARIPRSPWDPAQADKAAPWDIGNALDTTMTEVRAHTHDPRLYLTELTWYEH